MITDFLKTKTSKEDLKIALKVLKEFKSFESQREWALNPFSVWIKLEQLEEFLAYLVDGKDLEEDTIKYMNSEVSEDIDAHEIMSHADATLIGKMANTFAKLACSSIPFVKDDEKEH